MNFNNKNQEENTDPIGTEKESREVGQGQYDNKEHCEDLPLPPVEEYRIPSLNSSSAATTNHVRTSTKSWETNKDDSSNDKISSENNTTRSGVAWSQRDHDEELQSVLALRPSDQSIPRNVLLENGKSNSNDDFSTIASSSNGNDNDASWHERQQFLQLYHSNHMPNVRDAIQEQEPTFFSTPPSGDRGTTQYMYGPPSSPSYQNNYEQHEQESFYPHPLVSSPPPQLHFEDHHFRGVQHRRQDYPVLTNGGRSSRTENEATTPFRQYFHSHSTSYSTYDVDNRDGRELSRQADVISRQHRRHPPESTRESHNHDARYNHAHDFNDASHLQIPMPPLQPDNQPPPPAHSSSTRHDLPMTLYQQHHRSAPNDGPAVSAPPVHAAPPVGHLLPYYNRRVLPLATGEDENWLSEFLCFVRTECIEVFKATPEDVAVRMNSKKVLRDQVGFRCRFCAHLPARERTGRSSSFPSSIDRIYQSLTMMIRDHFPNCHAMPPELKERYLSLKANSSQGATDSKRYWVDSARTLGLRDTASSGIRFA